MYDLQQGEFLFSYLMQLEKDLGMSLLAVWVMSSRPVISHKCVYVPANPCCSPFLLQWDNIQELLGHPVEKPVVLHR